MNRSRRWKKIGRVLEISDHKQWAVSHSAVPFAEHVTGDIYKIFFTARDTQSRSHTACGLLDLSRASNSFEINEDPVLAPGGLGAFDDSGAMGSWLTSVGEKTYLYYQGWNLGVTVPFRNSIGVAVRNGDGLFTRLFDGPILDRTAREPHFTATPCVLEDNGRWDMWYLSCVGWELEAGRPKHRYHIKHAQSDNGLDWNRNGEISIDFKNSSEYAISRPSVMRRGNIWRMWYSFRGHRYRIGYAESEDGINWERMDDRAGIDVAQSGWDSDMIEYPFVFCHGDATYMLYNGNDYGRTGFGLAVLE
ncbi:hypothetical protein F4V91_29675 [Neorhizobium galegae]|uniref:Glycosyl hydrolase family 32 N-terminal domain-containing protein n=1 Tax=Neorhizobium galegae TaxID=399 RepID=A0A6A1TL89_NEOGA|nr:hypothetical protein [Neorhizobium galegae]KAB1083646.1 hypothetical protein F4V91_29675 [Neorhizobium galegae]